MLSEPRKYSIFNEMERLQKEMNRLFDIYSPQRSRIAPSFPALNVWSSNDEVMLTAELPGVHLEDLDITITGSTLMLQGSREGDEVPGGTNYHRQERGFGKFARSIELPFNIEANKIEATLENGILKITLPRAEKDKPKKIKVKYA
jgi:HSP20 family protein